MQGKQTSIIFKLAAFALLFSCAAVLLSYFFSAFTSRAQKSGAVSENDGSICVIIDAGHGGEDGGTQSASGLLEKEVNLEIAKKLEKMLTASGIDVIMTRSEDVLLYDKNSNYQGHKKSLDLAARLKVANETPNAIFVSIHANSFPISKYSGLQVYYSQNDERSYSLAKTIQDDVREFIQNGNDRKIKAASSNIYLLDNAICPAVLVECGFLSNPDEAAMLADDTYRQKIAFSMFCSIIKYIDSEGGSEL